MIKVRVPATTANLGPGFDCLGLALELYNTLEVALEERGETWIEVQGEGAESLPRSASNLVYRSMVRLYRELGRTLPPVSLKLNNRIPLARGMGSSAAAIVAGLLAANELNGQALSRERLLDLAVELEGHPDNIAPALLGGLVISSPRVDSRGYHYLKVEPPEELQAVLCVPNFPVATEEARKVLPAQISLKDAVFNVGRVSLLLGTFLTKRWDLLSEALQDRLHQPYRESLVPGMNIVMAEALEAGALGAALSGSGPTIIAFVRKDAIRVAQAMVKAFTRMGIQSRPFILGLDRSGAEIQGHLPCTGTGE